jgi:hypothetical protein
LAGLLAASVLLHLTTFAFVLDRPLSLGTLRRELEAKLAYAASLPSPRLIILAGSNALFSHRCAIIGPMLRLPCVNGGVALGLGLDYQFLRWESVLRPGDIVYLPMELQQYAMTSRAAVAGPDLAIMLRHDRSNLLALGPSRWPAALLSGTLEDLILSVVEIAASAARPDLARHTLEDIDSAGDGIGHTLRRAAANRAFLSGLHRSDPSPPAILAGRGTREIAAFLAWAAAHRVRAIGGWPTEFADAPQDPRLAETLRRLYVGKGAAFLPLANQGRYPRDDFFDTQDHLAEECQVLHSIRVAQALAPMLYEVGVAAPSGWAVSLAAACPGSPG